MAERIVVALGGNALGKTPEEQLRLVTETVKPLARLIEEGYELVVTHGNGPQVGMINLGLEYASQRGGGTPFMPFAECGAMTQGYIGYHLQQALQNELRQRGIQKDCATVVTQVLVEETDPGFLRPSKPVGSFYSREEAERIAAEKGFHFVEDAGRGYRRVVPSPLPKAIVELSAVKKLLEAGVTVITAGGGGIPVVEREGRLHGVAAVIDKDRAAALLAKELKADRLLILTAVERVCLYYGSPQQRELSEMTLEEAERFLAEGHFAQGSMGPKVEACLAFARSGGSALITSLSKVGEAIEGKTGTRIG